MTSLFTLNFVPFTCRHASATIFAMNFPHEWRLKAIQTYNRSRGVFGFRPLGCRTLAAQSMNSRRFFGGGDMPLKFIRSLIAVSCLSLAVSPAFYAKDPEDAAKQASKASKVFQEIMAAPDNAIPASVLDKAQCVAVFPQVFKAGFIFGGRGGRGVASCRVADGWSDPAYFDLKGGSFGLQIGAQATDFVLLFMNHDGMKSLVKSKFELGGDASVAAGPVGRQAGASTDLKLDE